MIKFTPVPKSLKYMLAEDYKLLGGLNIPKGFMIDGASIPWWAWWITYTPTDTRVMRAGLVHDWLYYTKPRSRADADRTFYHCAIEDGCTKLKAWLMWAALRIAGWAYWKNTTEDEMHLQVLRRSIVARGLDPTDYGL